jgi:hypothetical protein
LAVVLVIVAAAASYPVTYIQTNPQQGQQTVTPQQYRILLQQPQTQIGAALYQQDHQPQTETLIYQPQPQQVQVQPQSQAQPQTQTLIYQQQPQQVRVRPQTQPQVYAATRLKARPLPPQQAGAQPIEDPEDYDVSSDTTFMTYCTASIIDTAVQDTSQYALVSTDEDGVDLETLDVVFFPVLSCNTTFMIVAYSVNK